MSDIHPENNMALNEQETPSAAQRAKFCSDKGKRAKDRFEFEKAEKLYKEAVQISSGLIEENDPDGNVLLLVNDLYNLGEIYINLKQSDTAFKMYEEGLKVLEEHTDAFDRDSLWSGRITFYTQLAMLSDQKHDRKAVRRYQKIMRRVNIEFIKTAPKKRNQK